MKKAIIPIVLIIVIATIVFVVRNNRVEDSNAIIASGTIEVTEVDISSKIAGRIVEFIAREGDRVEQGQLLVKLDQSELAAQMNQVLAQVSAADAQVSEVLSSLRNIETNVERNRQLYEVGSVPKKSLDDLETEYTVAQDRYRSAQEKLKQAQASVDYVSAQIENTVIRSPISGLVLQKNMELGEMALPGVPILTIGDLHDSWLKIYVEETKLGLVKLGQRAEITTDTYPDKVYEGRVSYIASEAEFTPKTIQTTEERVKLVFEVKITVDSEDQELKPGMPADAEIVLNEKFEDRSF